MNQSTALNRMRSANPPMTSAGVMMAKVSWNMKNAVSGTVPDERVARRRRQNHTLPTEPMKPLQRAAVAESEPVAAEQPQHAHDAGDREALHEHREHVLGADEPGVERREPRQRHEEHERGGGEQPGGVPGIGRRSLRVGSQWKTQTRTYERQP